MAPGSTSLANGRTDAENDRTRSDHENGSGDNKQTVEHENTLCNGGETTSGGNLSDDELERLHFLKVMKTFITYEQIQLPLIEKHESDFKSLPKSHQALLSQSYLPRLSEMRKLISLNQKFLAEIVADATHVFHNSNPIGDEDSSSQAAVQQQQPTRYDYEKVRTTLRQFVRDWSSDGVDERVASYQPIVDEIAARFPELERRGDVRVLVPGSGLGRLAFEIAKLGFECQGNEWSVFMLFASNFILNKSSGTDQWTIYPWVTQTCNQPSAASQLRGITVPDIDPRTVILPDGGFSMVAGDFLEVYTQAEDWDVVATCFFLDTAHNIVAYLEKIHYILKPGGYLINLGPLLYHYSDLPHEQSLDLTYEEVLSVIEDIGFTVIKREDNMKSPYITNQLSLLNYIYNTPFLVAQKKPSNTNQKM